MSVFDSIYADQYDQLYAEKNYASECDLVEAAVKQYSRSRPETVLDIGCGTGGHAIGLSQRGYAVTGVDFSESMLSRAKAKSALLAVSNRPTWICGDARNFETGQSYDLAIMMFAVVGYLTSNADLIAGLRNIRRQLKPGSLVICDFWYGPSVLSIRPTDKVRVIPTTRGKIIRTASTTLDISSHTADVTFNLWEIADDRIVSESCETHRMRYFFPQEFTLLLSLAGFELQSISAFPTLDQELTDKTWNALTVARAA